jgi:AcrR family transcriptional regulator
MSNASPTSAKRRRAATVTRPYGGVHADTRRQERRARILTAGLEVIGTRGFHQSTVRDVCAQSGLSERYFYESFKGMGLLFEALHADLHAESQRRVMAGFVGASAVKADAMQMAESALIAWLLYLKEDVRRARILLIEAVTVNESSLRSTKAAFQDFTSIIQAFVQRVYPDIGKLGYETRMLSSVLAGACLQGAKTWMWADFRQPVEEVASHLTVVFRSLHDFYEREAALLLKPSAEASTTKSRRRAGA